MMDHFGFYKAATRRWLQRVVRRLTANIGIRKPQLPSGLQSFAQRAIRDVSQPIC
jgi:hypothetical protein